MCYLFKAARTAAVPDDWTPADGPLTWRHGKKGRDVLGRGRRAQLGIEELRAARSPRSQPVVTRTDGWEVPPHSAFFLPFLTDGPPSPEAYLLYCDVLLLLTALDGDERILDGLVQHGVGTVPFEDRWGWRARIHLSARGWRLVERVLRWAERPATSLDEQCAELEEELGRAAPAALTWDDFTGERIDLSVDPRRDIEVARTVRPTGEVDDDLPDDLRLRPDTLSSGMIVRLGQVSIEPDRNSVLQNFPAMDLRSQRQIMEQVAAVFLGPMHGVDDRDPQLVVLPEVSVPQPEVPTVRSLVAQTGRASLAGLFWRALPPVYAPAAVTTPARRWFVNEAELVLPLGLGDRGPTSVRWFRVRKPLPAHIEVALGQALSSSGGGAGGSNWCILPGCRWYRFVHPAWGDFTVAICSDLLDAAPWRSLRGEILHLFMCAFNPDVDLYDALTWVRAYESYVNVVGVNHGHYGGSFLWSPRRRSGRELARLRGNHLFLTADVELPVRALLDQQTTGVATAVADGVSVWTTGGSLRREFKSPPPGYGRRALKDP